MLGLSLSSFTLLHVLISLAGIATGLVAMLNFARGHWLPRMTHVFLISTLATTISGFLFPFKGFTPAIGVGIVSSAVLAAAYISLYVANLRGSARTIYAASAVVGLYLNIFVLFVQSFQKIPFLHGLAPSGTEPPFVAAQATLLIAAAAIGYVCVRAARRWTTATIV